MADWLGSELQNADTCAVGVACIPRILHSALVSYRLPSLRNRGLRPTLTRDGLGVSV
jgi:hypothetical protein